VGAQETSNTETISINEVIIEMFFILDSFCLVDISIPKKGRGFRDEVTKI